MIIGFKDDKKPIIKENVFIAKSADIIGDVVLSSGVNIWFGAVLRGDSDNIYVGKNTNIQENSVVHVADNYCTKIGNGVTIGHSAIIHGCTIGDNCLIGMGSTIMNGAEIGENTIIGAGSLVTQGKKIPSGVLCMGSPAKVIRNLTDEEIQANKKSANDYFELSKKYINCAIEI